MPVRSFAATPLYQLVGNAWEMVEGASAPEIPDVCTSTMIYVGLNSYVPVRSANSCGGTAP